MKGEFVRISDLYLFQNNNCNVNFDVPYKDISDDKVQIKLESHCEKKTLTKFLTLRKKLGRQKVQEIEDKSEESTEWFKVSDISFHESQTKKLLVRISLINIHLNLLKVFGFSKKSDNLILMAFPLLVY